MLAWPALADGLHFPSFVHSLQLKLKKYEDFVKHSMHRLPKVQSSHQYRHKKNWKENELFPRI
jgi:hypothetical protein